MMLQSKKSVDKEKNVWDTFKVYSLSRTFFRNNRVKCPRLYIGGSIYPTIVFDYGVPGCTQVCLIDLIAIHHEWRFSQTRSCISGAKQALQNRSS